MWQLCPWSELLQGPDKVTAASGVLQLLQLPPLTCISEPVGHLQLFVCKCPSAPSRDRAQLYKPAMLWEPSRGMLLAFMLPEQYRRVTHEPPRAFKHFPLGCKLNEPKQQTRNVFHAVGMAFWSFFTHCNTGSDLCSEEKNPSLLNFCAAG